MRLTEYVYLAAVCADLTIGMGAAALPLRAQTDADTDAASVRAFVQDWARPRRTRRFTTRFSSARQFTDVGILHKIFRIQYYE